MTASDAQPPPKRNIRPLLRDRYVRIFTVACLLSVLLWVGSIWIEIQFQSPSGHFFGWFCGGRMTIAHTPVASPDWLLISIDRNDLPHLFYWWFEWDGILGTIHDFWGFHIPLWIFVLISGLLLIAAFRRAARRAKLVQCPSCGYSRSGLAPRSPCPECGDSTHEEICLVRAPSKRYLQSRQLLKHQRCGLVTAQGAVREALGTGPL